MAAQSPLTGVVLVDCAKANAKSGSAIAATQCGYGDDIQGFRAALQSACDEMGVTFDDLSDLINEDKQSWPTQIGFEAASNTLSEI
jgi:hypothetical protein